MDLIVGSAAAALICGYFVAGYKLSFPAAPSWTLMIAALLSGIASAFLIFFGDGGALTTQTAAQTITQGIAAAAAAAGLTRTDEAGENKRFDAKQEEDRESP
jgi:hypothetical protein